MSILNELTYNPSDHVPKPLSNDVDPIVPNVDKSISSQPISKDQPVDYEDADSSNQEVSTHIDTNESSNPIILLDHPESQIIGDVNDGIFTRSKVSNNFCMFVNFVSMIELNNINDALKEAD